MSLYLNIFIEALHYASIVPLANEPTFFAMHAFGGFDMGLAVLCASLGAAIGACFNFYIGFLLKRGFLKIGHKKHLTAAQYEKARHFFSRYGFLFLIFSWLPIFNFFVLVAGFLGLRAKIALPIVIAGQVVHYSWFLFH